LVSILLVIKIFFFFSKRQINLPVLQRKVPRATEIRDGIATAALVVKPLTLLFGKKILSKKRFGGRGRYFVVVEDVSQNNALSCEDDEQQRAAD
jgi:hypothetical protein